MARIKIPESTTQLTTLPTAAIQQPAAFTRRQQALQSLTNQLAATAEVFRQGIITEQVSKATLITNEFLLELEDKFKTNPNRTAADSDQFRIESDKFLQKQMDTIGDPATTRKFQLQFSADILMREFSVRQSGRVAQQDRYEVDTINIGQQSIDNIVKSGNNLAEVIIHRQKYIGQLDLGILNLYIDKEERAKRIIEFDDLVKKTQEENAKRVLLEMSRQRPEELISLVNSGVIVDTENFVKISFETIENIEKFANTLVTSVREQERSEFMNRTLLGQPLDTAALQDSFNRGLLTADDVNQIKQNAFGANVKTGNIYTFAELTTKQALGTLQMLDIQTADDITPTQKATLVKSLTSDLQTNPAVKRAVALWDAQIKEGLFGVRSLIDEQKYAGGVEEIIQRSMEGKENPLEVVKDLIKKDQEIKEEELETLNIRRGVLQDLGRKNEKSVRKLRRRYLDMLDRGEAQPVDINQKLEILELIEQEL